MTDKQKFVLMIVAIVSVAACVVAMVIAGKSDHMLDALAGSAGVLAFFGFCWLVFRG